MRKRLIFQQLSASLLCVVLVPSCNTKQENSPDVIPTPNPDDNKPPTNYVETKIKTNLNASDFGFSGTVQSNISSINSQWVLDNKTKIFDGTTSLLTDISQVISVVAQKSSSSESIMEIDITLKEGSTVGADASPTKSNTVYNLVISDFSIDSSIPKGWSRITNRDWKSADQISIDESRRLHYNYPHYDESRNLLTLKADGEPANNTPTPGTPGKNWAKEGVITTENHVQLAKQVFSVGFHDGVEKTGTAWILDYKLTTDGTYPVTWYFGTNAHVIDDLKVADDTYHPDKFGQWDPVAQDYRGYNTEAISLWRIADPQTKEYGENWASGEWLETKVNFYDPSKMAPVNGGQYYKRTEGYYHKETPLKTIFTGNDFLTTSPSDYSTNSYSDREEYADFAVFELTFDNEHQAKAATNDYANWEESKKFKYHEEDLLKNPSLKTNRVYEVGYPMTGQISTVAARTVAINLNAEQYDGVWNKEDKGSGLSESPNYNNWDSIKGPSDGHIVLPSFGYQYEYVDNSVSATGFYAKTRTYATYGLLYGTNNGNMRPGSSGALVVDENGYALGIHFASDNNAATGDAQAFYSSGYDYKGYYGGYNLPQYDLIRGGGKYQKKSYYDGMVQRYGKDPNFKTRLFPNGLTSRR